MTGNKKLRGGFASTALWGLSILTLVFGFALAGCDKDDDSSGPLDGVWECESYKITISGKNWTLSLADIDVTRGTLKLENKAITLTITQTKGESGWVDAPSSPAMTGTLKDDNSFDLTIGRESKPFTKK
jgi:hypothetical protein